MVTSFTGKMQQLHWLASSVSVLARKGRVKPYQCITNIHKFDSLSSFPNVILTTWVGWSKQVMTNCQLADPPVWHVFSQPNLKWWTLLKADLELKIIRFRFIWVPYQSSGSGLQDMFDSHLSEVLAFYIFSRSSALIWVFPTIMP